MKVAALTLVAMLAAGCGTAATSTPAPATSPTHGAPTRSVPPATSPTHGAPSHSAPPTTAAPTPATSSARVPMQTATGGEFLSPSGNISCEVDYQRAGLTQVYCQTVTPPRSVTMGVTGTYTTCTGQQCLGNPGAGTPTLAYGTATGVGPFVCESATPGVSCMAGGRGFRISASAVTPMP
jgi:hypothetical protein